MNVVWIFATVLVLSVLGVAAYRDISYGRTHTCTKSHQEMYMQLIPNGSGGVIMIPQFTTQCDHWEPKQ